MQKPKVLFTLVEAGMGHIIPANSIADSFVAKYGEYVDVDRQYIFRDSDNKAVRKYGKALTREVKLLHACPLYSRIQDAMNGLLSSKSTLSMLDIVNGRAKKGVIEQLSDRYDVIFSTYFSPSHFAMCGRRQGKWNGTVLTLAPDCYIYPAWDRQLEGRDKFLVTSGQGYNNAIKEGFDAQRVVQVSYPVNSKWLLVDKDKSAMRQRLQLEDKLTVLVSFGGYGIGNGEKIVRALARSGLDINIIAICSHNERLLQQLASLNATSGNIIVKGYVDNMQEYCVASDLVIGKTGANSVAECLAVGTPMIASYITSRVERETAQLYLTQLGCGKVVKGVAEAIRHVEQIYFNNSILQQYVDNISQLNIGNGAMECADVIWNTLVEQCEQLSEIDISGD